VLGIHVLVRKPPFLELGTAEKAREVFGSIVALDRGQHFPEEVRYMPALFSLSHNLSLSLSLSLSPSLPLSLAVHY
jgi:hypothetical protein